MRKLTLCLVMLPLFLGFFKLSAEERVDNTELEASKTYVHLEDVVFGDSRILLADSLNRILTEIKALRSDARGYYYLSSDTSWTCPRCHTSYPGEYGGQTCQKCGWPLWRQNR